MTWPMAANDPVTLEPWSPGGPLLNPPLPRTVHNWKGAGKDASLAQLASGCDVSGCASLLACEKHRARLHLSEQDESKRACDTQHECC